MTSSSLPEVINGLLGQVMTGGTVSPGIFDVVSVLGKDAVLARIQKALASLARYLYDAFPGYKKA